MAEEKTALELKLVSHMNKTIHSHHLLREGDRVMVPAKYTTDDGRFEVIRPLIEIVETDIARFAELEGFPTLPCTLCGSAPDLKRDAMGRLLTQLEALNPLVRESMMGASGVPSEKPKRFGALPVHSRDGFAG